MKSFGYLVALFASAAGSNILEASKPKWNTKISTVRGWGVGNDECVFKPSAALTISSVAVGAYAIQSCFPESFNDMHTSLDDFVDSKSGKFWERWFSTGLFQQTALTAAAAASKDEGTKKMFCLVSALNWGMCTARLIFNRENANADMQNVDLAVNLGMIAVMLAGAGGFDWIPLFKDKVKDASKSIK
jgi:hypothetical protein